MGSTYRGDYGSAIPLSHLTQRVSSYMHAYTLYSSIRPFGATIMLGTWGKEDGAQLMMIEPWLTLAPTPTAPSFSSVPLRPSGWMDVVKKVGSFGSQSGKTSKKIVIVDC